MTRLGWWKRAVLIAVAILAVVTILVHFFSQKTAPGEPPVKHLAFEREVPLPKIIRVKPDEEYVEVTLQKGEWSPLYCFQEPMKYEFWVLEHPVRGEVKTSDGKFQRTFSSTTWFKVPRGHPPEIQFVAYECPGATTVVRIRQTRLPVDP